MQGGIDVGFGFVVNRRKCTDSSNRSLVQLPINYVFGGKMIEGL